MTRPSRFSPKLSADLAAALAVSLAPLVYFLPATLGRLVISPDDGVIFNVPVRAAAASIVRGGSLPLWNPYLFSGMPLHGAAQAGVLFPLNWFFLVFDAPAAANLMMLSSYALAALGAYLYARRSGARVAGATLTAVVYQWCGFLVAQIGHTNVVQTAGMLPWLLWAVDGYGATGDRKRGVLLAAIVALQAFTGHQQTLAYSLLVAAAYALVMWRTQGPSRKWYPWSLALAAAGLALAAVQILPTYELMRNSLRARASFDFFSSFSLPPRFLLTFLAPYVVGGGDGRLFRAPYVGEPFYGEYIGYVGVGALMAGALAFALRRDARTTFWAVVALAALALALGRNWPFKLYGVIYYTPVLGLFRVPARHMMEVDFALAVLAGRGLAALLSAENRARAARRSIAVGACVFALTCLAVTLGRPSEFRLARAAPVTFLRAPELFLPVAFAALSAWALWRLARSGSRGATCLFVAVVALDLCVWGQSSGWRNGPTPEAGPWRAPPAVRALRERRAGDEGPYRILTVAQFFDPDAPTATTGATAEGKLILDLQPDTYMMHGVENAAGYDGFGLARYSRLADDMKVWGDISDPRRSLAGDGREFDLLGVRYLVVRNPPGRAAPANTQSADAPRASSSTTLAPQEMLGGYGFASEDFGAQPLDRGERLVFNVPSVAADRVALVTNLSWSTGLADGTEVGRVRLRSDDGRSFVLPVRAGEHTSEWAYDRSDVRPRIRHKRARVATSFAVEDARGRYEGHTYVAALALPEKASIVGGEIEVAAIEGAPDLALDVKRVSLLDGDRAHALAKGQVTKAPPRAAAQEGATAATATEADSTGGGAAQGVARWRRVAELDEVSIYENARALPRAWLAPEAVVVTDEAALAAIRAGRLPDGRPFDPRRTALVSAPLKINLSDGTGASAGEARITRRGPNHVEVAATHDAAAVLVLGDNFYPGWRAEVDGREAELLRVDYNLRGVALAPGSHEVRFFYRPWSVILGALVSLLTACGLAAWCLVARRRALVHETDA